jgi:hypothetical protein
MDTGPRAAVRWETSATTHRRLGMAAVRLGMRSGLVLLDDQQLFNRMADRVAKEHDLDRGTAGRILDQAIMFVATAGKYPGIGLSPSPQVDLGWDTFILYTADYASFCDRVAGRFVHHAPNDLPDGELVAEDGRRLYDPAETASILRAEGFRVYDDLWPVEAKANCTNCYSGDHQGGSGP